MQEEVRRIARTSGHITHGDAVKLEHAADLIEAQAAQLQEARELIAGCVAIMGGAANELEAHGVGVIAITHELARAHAFLAKSQ